MRIVAVALLIIGTAGAAFSQERPTVGTLANACPTGSTQVSVEQQPATYTFHFDGKEIVILESIARRRSLRARAITDAVWRSRQREFHKLLQEEEQQVKQEREKREKRTK